MSLSYSETLFQIKNIYINYNEGRGKQGMKERRQGGNHIF